jgi:putative endonuclease
MERGGCIYIMTNYQRSTLYVGVTSDLLTRIFQHRDKFYQKSFSAKYNLSICIYYEMHPTIEDAIGTLDFLILLSRPRGEIF